MPTDDPCSGLQVLAAHLPALKVGAGELGDGLEVGCGTAYKVLHEVLLPLLNHLPHSGLVLLLVRHRVVGEVRVRLLYPASVHRTVAQHGADRRRRRRAVPVVHAGGRPLFDIRLVHLQDAFALVAVPLAQPDWMGGG